MMKRGMASSSDDEAEADAQSLAVSGYHLEDEEDMPVCFSVLPLRWSDSENSDADGGKVFLHGFADNGLQKIFMQVIAWRFDLSNAKPEISLLLKDGKWIVLQKPRTSFLETVRTVLVTIHFLHRMKKNPQLSAASVWNHFCKDKELSSCGLKPSRDDLLEHMPLIDEAAKRDDALAKSKLLPTILKKPKNQKLSDKEVKDLIRPGLTVDGIADDMIDKVNEESETEDASSVCALCDNGGDLVCCEGSCMRSFHGTKEDGRESACDSLGLTQKEVDEVKSFYCENCEYNQHQCFACGKLGSSDKVKGAEVIKCASRTCGHFYHPHCIAKLLPGVVKDVTEDLERNIANGNPITCPLHYCCACKELENKMDPELQFAVCQRCPKSYHRKCLPREIAFDEKDDEDMITRAWEGLLPNNRILIYCLNHEIDDELGTPIRDHIKFPNMKAIVRKIKSPNGKMKSATKQRAILKNKADSSSPSGKSTAKGSKVTGELSSEKVSGSNSKKIISGSNISRKPKPNETSRCLSENKRSITKKSENKHNNQVDDMDDEAMLLKPISVLPPLKADSETRVNSDVNRGGQPLEDLGASGHQASVDEGQKSLHDGNVDQESQQGQKHMVRKSGKTSQKRKRVPENDVSEAGRVTPAKRQAVNKMSEGEPDHSEHTPRLDESNDVKVSCLDSEPLTFGGSGSPERGVPHSVGLQGFACRVDHEYARRNSAGWIID